MQAPSVGRIVHYVSYGSPVLPDGSQKYKPQCRAAIVTELCDEVSDVGSCVGLSVLNPTGLFFDQHVCPDEENKSGGTWHWPERV
jgi:hypothetical protein